MEEPNDVIIVTNVYGDVCVRKARRKRQKLLVKELMYDYANNTTLHGLPYVTRTGLTIIEKIFWLITFLASVSMCLYLISQVWFKWQNSPVIVTVSEQLVPVSMVPFPSVTICPQSKCKVSVYNYTNEKIILEAFTKNKGPLNETMTKRLDKFEDLSKLCKVYTTTPIDPYHTDYSVVENILEVAPNHTDVFLFCYLRQKRTNCTEMFSRVLTSEGVCFNMNSLAASEIFRTSLQKDYTYLDTSKPSKGWSVEYGYDKSSASGNSSDDSDYYPIRGAVNGERPDVEVVLKHTERDLLCNGLNSGFKVYINHPTDLAQSSLYYYAVIKNWVTSMALSFNILSTSASLKKYDAEIRQCYFPDERYLKYFKLYTANNCMIECLSNISLAMCGCVAFHMPHEKGDKICTRKRYWCLTEARNEMLLQELDNNKRCHCLPPCNTVDYEAEILKTKFHLKRFVQNYMQSSNSSIPDSHAGVTYSRLELYFKRPRYLSMRRSELFGLIEFLANCGGLLGLFLGFSFLSLVEIFYFLSLRLCCTIKKDLEEEKIQTEPGKEICVDKY